MGIRSVTRGAGRFGTARGRHAAVLSLGALACAMLCSLALNAYIYTSLCAFCETLQEENIQNQPIPAPPENPASFP